MSVQRKTGQWNEREKQSIAKGGWKEKERARRWRKGKESWRSSSAAVVGGASVPDTAGVNSQRPYDLLGLKNQTDQIVTTLTLRQDYYFFIIIKNFFYILLGIKRKTPL